MPWNPDADTPVRMHHLKTGIARMPLQPCAICGVSGTVLRPCEVCNLRFCEACLSSLLFDSRAFPSFYALCQGTLLCCCSCAQVAHGYLCRLEDVFSQWRDASKEVAHALHPYPSGGEL